MSEDGDAAGGRGVAQGQKKAMKERESARRRRARRAPMDWFPWFWRDWLTHPGIRAMSGDERGRFADVRSTSCGTRTPGMYTEEQCRRWAGYSEEEWSAHRGAFAACHTLRAGGIWVDPPMRAEALSVRERLRGNRKRARDAAQKRWNDRLLDAARIAPGMPGAMHSQTAKQSTGVVEPPCQASPVPHGTTPETSLLARELLGRVAERAGREASNS